MYILGHTVFAYLILRPFIKFKKDNYGPELILFIFIFANIIDSIHVGIFRFLVHNLIGTILYSAFWLLFFYKIKLVRKNYIPFLVVATASHVINDYLFSKYHFLVPFSNEAFKVFGFNTFEAIMTESILAIIFIVVLFATKDADRLKRFSSSELRKFFNELNVKNLLSPRFYYGYLILAFFFFVLSQVLIYVRFNYNPLLNFVLFRWFGLIIFIIFFIVISYLTINISGLKKSINK